MNRKIIILLLLFVAGLVACNRQESKIEDQFLGFQQPANFPNSVYHFETNPVTETGFKLGRKLFYDPILSRDNTISCGTCHIQTSAFTQHGHSVSHGINDLLGTRNSPGIMNLAWSKTFMWDGGIFDLDLQSIAPITNPVEMDNTVENVLSKLNASAPYKKMFKEAFGDENISSARFLKALSQFMLMCVSANSKYDSVMNNKSSFTAMESQGYALFQSKCNSCHKEPLFTDNSFRNNGLNPSSVNDSGRYLISLDPNDMYKFKVPSLRNLAYSAPYMHDGRLLTLDAVMRHYKSNIAATPNLDPLLTNGIALSEEETIQLLAFLNTLNDRSFLLNKQLSEQ